MGKRITFVGLDAHKVSTSVAVLQPGAERPVEWQVSTERGSIRKMVKKVLGLAPGKVRFCYEAGPCGYALQRWIQELGGECMVVAPSLIPRKSGERIKTDRRDARKLAELFRAGLLTEVHPPSEADEAVRDLCRAREDAHEDLIRSRHRLSKFLLRRGRLWLEGKRAWSQGHRLWLRSLRFEHTADQIILEDYLLAIELVEERLRGLDAQIEKVSQQAPYAEVVGALRCFRGIDTLTAMTLVAELHDFMRFDSARALMAFLGLVPSEHSSGGKKQRGEITKAGNGHARRLLIEAAWHYRHRPGVQSLRARRQGQPALTVALADKAMRRLHRRFTHLLERGKPRPKVAVAIARELTGFIWAAMRQPKPPELTTHTRFTLGGRSRRMKAGTIQRMRVAALRLGGQPSLTRALRPRRLATENGHAALRSRATRAYQNDSSSKRPASSVVLDLRGGGPLRMLQRQRPR